MNETIKHETNSSLTTLNDGCEIQATFTDGHTEPVKVRKVPIRHMDRLARAWEKEPEEILMYTDRDSAWTDTLSDDSWEAIIELGRQLNEAPFGRWFNRKRKALDALGLNLDQIAKTSVNSSSS